MKLSHLEMLRSNNKQHQNNGNTKGCDDVEEGNFHRVPLLDENHEQLVAAERRKAILTQELTPLWVIQCKVVRPKTI